MKRKMALVFMTLVMAVSLAFGMTAITANAATELAWPETFATSDWAGATELRLPTDYTDFNGGDLNPTAETLGKVKITRGETVYACSNVYGWVNKLTFYFNGSGYNGQSAQRGDILTVDAGFSITKNGNEYTSADGKQYIFTGAEWISGTELPAEAEIEFPETIANSAWNSDTELRIPTGFTVKNAQDLHPTAEALALVKITRGETVYKASHVYEWNGCLTFYFNNSGYTGKTAPQKGDLLTVGAGFEVKHNGLTYVCKDGIQYIYTGSEWIKGNELPAEVEIAFPATISTSAWFGDTELRIPTGFTVKNAQDLHPTAEALALVKITRGETVYNASHIYEYNGCLTFYFNGSGYTGKTAPARGDLLTVGAGFTVNHNGTTYVCADGVKYIFNGLYWLKGETLAEQTELELADTLDGSEWNANGNEVRIPSNIENRDAQSLNPVSDALALVKIVRGETVYQATHVYGWSGADKIGRLTFYFNNTGYNGKNPQKGDKLVIGENFMITSGGTEFVCTSGKTYVFNGELWVDEADYVDYSKFTRTGIVADENEITLYKGDKFVVPALHYTYAEDVNVPEAVEGEVTVENAPDMDTVNEEGYDVTLKAGEFSVTIKVKVLDTTELNITSVIADTSWSRIQIVTTSANATNNTADQFDNLAYFSYVRDGKELTIKNYITLTTNYAIDVIDEDGNHLIANKVSGVKVGDVLTIKKGLPFVDGERLAETVSYVYDGNGFVVLVEPEDFELEETSVSVFENVTKKIVVKAAEGVTAVYTYVSENPEIATVSAYGVITGVKEGTTKIKVSYKDIVKEMTVTVMPEPQKIGIEIVSDIATFYVPVSTAEAPTSFVGMGYTLKARYVFEGGLYGEEFDVTAEQIGEIDYTKAGNYDLKVTVGEFEAAVNVEVYNYREVTSFNTLGVSGYDINDDRNASGTWNGHMIIGMASVSTSVGNLLSTASCETMSEYIVYTTADGKTYYGKADKENGIEDRIGLWQLGTNLLVMIKPEGATANLGYGSEDHWKSDAAHPYVPIYKLGDKITFKKGMPIYAWKGSLDGSNKPLEGAGCLIVEGYVAEDIVYFCYEENGTSSLWMIYKEYTDFTVTAEKTMALGSASPAGAVKVPADATTGTFTYVSDNPEIVSVTKDGNMIAEKVGTATITITLTGGKDADGNDLAPIVKTIKVTVKNGIKSVSGSIKVLNCQIKCNTLS